MVTLEPSSTDVSATPAVPPTSVKATEKVIAPFASLLWVVTAHVHVLPAVLVTVTELSMLAPSPSFIVHVGLWIVSLEVKVSVTISPSLALPVPAVAIPIEPRVGAVVSRVYAWVATELGFPAASTTLSLILLDPLNVTPAIETAVPSPVA